MKNGCANRVESRACSSYPEVKPAIDEVGVRSEWDYSSLRQKAKVQRRKSEGRAKGYRSYCFEIKGLKN